MKVSDKGLIELVCSEGIVPYPYLDSVGVWTYGIGHTKGAGAPDPALMKRGVATPIKDCIELFRKDLAKYESEVLKAVKVSLKQHEFDALVHWHYNTGAIAKATLTKRLNAGDRKGAAAQFLVWNNPAELTPRREKERKLFEQGIYSNNGKALVYTADAKGRLGKATSQSVANLLRPYPAKTTIVSPGVEVEKLPKAPYPTPLDDTSRPREPAPPVQAGADRHDGKHVSPPGFWSSLFALIAKQFSRRS